MPAVIRALVGRDDAQSEAFTPTMHALLITLLALAILALVLGGGLYILRQVRKKRSRSASELPMYERGHHRSSNHRSLTITTASNHRESVFVYQEKENLIRPQSPQSPVPEIRITFPEEVDDHGKRQSGRVVVVRVGDHGVGLEPVSEKLPPYQQSESERFHSLDLDRIGGLKEKEMR